MKYQIKHNASSESTFNIILYRKNNLDPNNLNNIQPDYPISIKEIIDTSSDNETSVRILLHNKLHTFLFIDLGKHQGFEQIHTDLSNILFPYKQGLSSSLQVDFRCLSDPDQIYIFTMTWEFIMYPMVNYKTISKIDLPEEFTVNYIVNPNQLESTEHQVTEAAIIAKNQKAIMDLVNGPGNLVNPPFLVNWIREKGKSCGFSTKILNKASMQEIGLHATLAVNQGSAWDPAFIIMEYLPKDILTSKTVGLVGKGITFDTGGLSIKTGPSMHYMKSDMGGAAAVFGTMTTVASLGWPIHLIGIVPVTDNCIDAKALKPGDVISAYGGKSIEVINTDAEGRLVLADGLAYMTRHFATDHLIDLATLTGSIVRTFGSECAGLFSNDNDLSERLIAAGNVTGEKLWPLPVWDAYKKEIQSDIADVKNLATKPVAGAITAAKFLEVFVEDHPSWAHLDIAGVAFGDTKYAKGKAATGFGVHLLTHFIKTLLSD